MFDAEIVVRVLVGGLFLGGILLFLTAPESRRQDIPSSVQRPWESEDVPS